MHLHFIPLPVVSDKSSLKHVVLYNRKEKRRSYGFTLLLKRVIVNTVNTRHIKDPSPILLMASASGFKGQLRKNASQISNMRNMTKTYPCQAAHTFHRTFI